MKRILTKTVVAIVLVLMLAGWGGTGHKIINRNITQCFPSSMNLPAYWSDTLTAHASDADSRKGKDPTESTRHFIDIDIYPEFVANDSINRDYNAFVALHGSSAVIKNGVLPWAIIQWKDSLTKAFKQQNWHLAMMLSADIGHYVGDGHQPLHCTANYDGGSTNQNGVHSRYETDLVGAYQTSIVYNNNLAAYISDVSSYTFKFIYLTNKYVDSTLYGDSVATVFDASQGTLYLQKYWELCGSQIIQLMKTASRATADIIYTAWVDAGSPNGTTPVELTSFSASVYKDLINLNWKTATELNNTGFDIERSSGDASAFIKLGFVKGAGNSVTANSYSFSDKMNFSGKYIYRLKQIDNDGSYKYSSPVEVNFNNRVDNFNLDQNYPNPFNPSTTIAYSLPLASNVKLSVFNALGQQVKIVENEFKNSGNYKITFNADDLNSGIYFYKLETGQFSQVRKMILIK